MIADPINDDILAIKRALAAKFDNDLDRIVADIRSREHNTVNYPPRQVTSEQGVAPESPSPPISPGHSNSATG